MEAGLDAGAFVSEGGRFAFDDDVAACVGKAGGGRHRCGPQPVSVDPAVTALAGFVFRVVDVDSLACFESGVPQLGLVRLDTEDVVGSFVLHDECRGVALRVQGVGGDDRAHEVEGLEERNEA